MENVSVSNKCDIKFTKKCLYSSDLLYCFVLLVISSPLTYKQPLDGSSNYLFQWLIHLKDSQLKTIVKYETTKTKFSNLNSHLTGVEKQDPLYL